MFSISTNGVITLTKDKINHTMIIGSPHDIPWVIRCTKI